MNDFCEMGIMRWVWGCFATEWDCLVVQNRLSRSIIWLDLISVEGLSIACFRILNGNHSSVNVAN